VVGGSKPIDLFFFHKLLSNLVTVLSAMATTKKSWAAALLNLAMMAWPRVD
jgi:hypothetical protein